MKMKARMITLLCIVVSMVVVGCFAPTTFVKTTAGWKTIEFNENIQGFDTAWQRCVDTIARDYDIEMIDKNSGYLRTAWIYGISGGVYNRYRGRITVKFSELKNPTMVDIKTEAQWLSDESSGIWTPGFDKNFQRDVYTALSGRLGRTVSPD
jgi:hypothetical protein